MAAGSPAAGKKAKPAKPVSVRAKAPKKAKPTPAPPLVTAGVMPVVYLDANVLIPEYLRATFLDLAYSGLAQVHWGEQVLVEVRRNLVKPRFGLTQEQVDKLFGHLNGAFPDGLVANIEPLQPLFAGKTDEGDEHVAAGALKTSQLCVPPGPVVLVTSNIKHLPQSAFVGTNVRNARPSGFLTALLAVEPRVASVIDQMLKRFSKPAISREDYLAILDKSHCAGFATKLAAAWGLGPVEK